MRTAKRMRLTICLPFLVLFACSASLMAAQVAPDPCKEVSAQQAWEQGSDPVYTDATELGRMLGERGFVVECIRSSKEARRFEGQKGAAWFKTDRGIFDVLFLPTGRSFDGLQVVSQPQRGGWYVYTFRGTPRTSDVEDSSKPAWFIHYKNMLFHVWGDQRLAETLEQVFQKSSVAPDSASLR